MRAGAVDVGCAILAGGRSSRLGDIPKGALRAPDGSTILGRLLVAAEGAGLRDIVVVANDPGPYREAGRPVVPDLRPGHGPLSGVETALRHFGGVREAVLLLPCDLPGITSREITRLLDAWAARSAPILVAETAPGGWHPLCAIVHNELSPAVSAALDRGHLKVLRLWRDLGAAAVPFDDPAPFFDVDTMEDWTLWCARQSGR